MIKKGVYCSKTRKEVEEKHGGITTKEVFYNHLCFYIPEKMVGFYGGSRMWIDPYFDKKFKYTGEIESIDLEKITFTVKDPFNGDEWLFDGIIANELLYIKASRKSEPGVIWLDDVFEYIGTGEDTK